MPKSTIEFAQRTRREKGKTKLSLQQTNDLVQDKLASVMKMQRSLHSASTMFKGTDTILPVQCKRVLSSLEKLGVNVQRFCEFLNESTDLPQVYGVLRYRLTSILYLIDEQIDEISELVDSFRDICMTCSPSLRRQRKEIYLSLKTLLMYIDDVEQRVEALDYESYRLQKRLQIAYQEELYANDAVEEDFDKPDLRVIK